MLDNIEYRELNKKKILLSVLVLPLLCLTVFFVIGLWYTFTEISTVETSKIIHYLLFNPIYVFLITALVWLPVIVVQLILEAIVINATTNLNSWMKILLFECFIISVLLFILTHRSPGITLFSIIIVISAQITRAFYINKRGIN